MPAACRPSDLLTVNIDQIPLLKDAMGPGIHIKPLRPTPKRDRWCSWPPWRPVASCHPLPPVPQVYTFSGCWRYAEYPDPPQTAGDYLYEPGGSVHTFVCPEDNTEDTVVLLWMEGAQIGFNQDGTLHHINDATSIQHVTETVLAAQGTGPVGYIHGGAAGVVKS